MHEQAAALHAPYVVFAIPLYAESHAARSGMDFVVVVDVPKDVQLSRLVARDGIDDRLARAMVAAQAPRAARLALAVEVLHNDGSLEHLHAQVDALHERLLAFAARGSERGPSRR